MNFSWCSRSQHGHQPIKLHYSWYHRNEVGEEEVYGVVEVVKRSHEHKHGPQAEDGEEGAVISMLELKDTAKVSKSDVSTVFFSIFLARSSSKW